MADEAPTPEHQDESPNLMLIVVGSGLRAETADRPLAYRLRERIHAWLERFGASLNIPLVPVVCSDLWYLQQENLSGRPTISLGGPGVNALSHEFFEKLNPAVVRNDEILIQLDPEFIDLRVCIWGRNHAMTVDALEMFVRKYLDGYLRAVATQVEPREE